MILTTERLTLSAFTEADWSFFLTLRQSPDVMRFMGAIACEDDIRTLFISRLNDNHARVIRDKNGEPLGDIGLHISTRYPQEADIGYAIAPFAQGKGIASEALNAWVLAANQGSVRLLEKLGFTRTQVLEKGYTINGVDYDDWAYRLEKNAIRRRNTAPYASLHALFHLFR